MTDGTHEDIYTANTVTIPKKEYNELLDNSKFLNCLELAGVVNWSGYDRAKEIWDEGVREKCNEP